MFLPDAADPVVGLLVNFERSDGCEPHDSVSARERNAMRQTLRVRRNDPIFFGVLKQVKYLGALTCCGIAGHDCVIVVPLADIENELFGGPMLLRVPAASLNDLAPYAQRMKHTGYPVYAIGTRISFDPAANYPKMLFKEIRALTNEEAMLVNELRIDPRTTRILSDNLPADPEVDTASPQPQFEQAAPAAYKIGRAHV